MNTKKIYKSLVFGGTIFAISSLAGVALASLTFNSTSVTSDNGFVGIGTSTPVVALDVAGDVNATQYRSGETVMLRFIGNDGAGGGSIFLGGIPTSSLASPSVGNGYSTIIGQGAGASLGNGAYSMTAVGTMALPAATTGNLNTAVGYLAGAGVGTGVENVAIGALTLGPGGSATGRGGLTGGYNVAIGNGALNNATATAAENIAVGYYSLGSLTTGIRNSALGLGSLNRITTGGDNVGIGWGAAYTSTLSTTTVAIGESALYGLTTGWGNVALGYQAGYAGTAITTGVNNLFLGTTSGALSASLSNATAIGYNSRVGLSNAMVLGGTGANQPNVGIGTSTPGQLFTVATSSPTPLFNVTAAGKVGVGTTTPGSAVTVANGDVYIASTTLGVIFQPAVGTCFRMTVTTTGAFVTSSVTCP